MRLPCQVCVVMLMLAKLHRAPAFGPSLARRLLRNYSSRSGGRTRSYGRRGGLAVANADGASAAVHAPLTSQAPPLKVQLFVDGTWLYYTLFGRDDDKCIIKARLGKHWTRSYQVKWDRIPVLVGRAIQKQLLVRQQLDRFVEVYRTTVFSSARADTSRESQRMRMFKQMQRLNFDVHLSTTIGYQEKCIDIALAVDMLHYATVPGDKDFIPAMARTREKGKRVVLCSMHNSCNKALLDPAAHTMDLDVIWLDDYLEELLEKDVTRSTYGENSPVPPDILCELVAGIIERNGAPMTSRLLGRELQTVVVGGVNLLALLKTHFINLRAFLESYDDAFICSQPNVNASNSDDQSSYIVALQGEALDSLREAKLGGAGAPADEVDSDTELEGDLDDNGATMTQEDSFAPLPENLESLKVVQLKGLLEERQLATTGRKADLIARLQEFEAQQVQLRAAAAAAAVPQLATEEPADDGGGEDGGTDGDLTDDSGAEESDAGGERHAAKHRYTYDELRMSERAHSRDSGRFQDALAKARAVLAGRTITVGAPHTPAPVAEPTEAGDQALAGLVKAYLGAQPGTEASSRNIGRRLAAMPWPAHLGGTGQIKSALDYLKSTHGSLGAYLRTSSGLPLTFFIGGVDNEAMVRLDDDEPPQ